LQTAGFVRGAGRWAVGCPSIVNPLGKAHPRWFNLDLSLGRSVTRQRLWREGYPNLPVRIREGIPLKPKTLYWSEDRLSAEKGLLNKYRRGTAWLSWKGCSEWRPGRLMHSLEVALGALRSWARVHYLSYGFSFR